MAGGDWGWRDASHGVYPNLKGKKVLYNLAGALATTMDSNCSVMHVYLTSVLNRFITMHRAYPVALTRI